MWSKRGRLNHCSVFKSAVIFSNVFQPQKHVQNPPHFFLSKPHDSACLPTRAYFHISGFNVLAAIIVAMIVAVRLSIFIPSILRAVTFLLYVIKAS